MTKRKFRKLKIVSLILSVIMLAYAIPFQAVAAKDDVAPVREPGITVRESSVSDPTLDWKGDPINSDTSEFGIESFEERNSRSTDGLTEGVYSFRNVGNPDMWFDTRGDSHNVGSYIQQYKYLEYYENPANTNYFERSGLFKVTIHPDYGTYIIRSMRNNRYTLGLYEQGATKYIQTQEIPLNDGDVEIEDTFEIAYNPNLDGYTIKRYGEEDYITSCNATASGSAGGMASCLQFTSSETTVSAWTVTKYTGPLDVGTVFEYPDSWDDIGLIQDVYENTRLVGWCTQPNYNTPYIIPVFGYDDMSDYLWNPDSARFTITPRFPGELRLNIGVSLSSENFAITSHFHGDMTYVSRIVPQEGAYYIQNSGTEKYIDIEGYYAVAGAQVIQYQYFASDSQMMWEIEHVPNSGGYVRIKSAAADIYLGINPSDPYDIILTEDQDDLSLWSIDVTQRKTLVFSCYDTKNNNLVIFAPNSTNHAAIQQTTYVNDSTDLKDEWHLVKKVISVVNYYDKTFQNYCKEYLDDAVSFANVVYARYLNIGIHMDGDAQSYEELMNEDAVANKCTRGNTQACSYSSCGATCEYVHHKNLGTMSDQLMGDPRECDHIYVLWSKLASGYCYEDESEENENEKHKSTIAVGAVYKKRPVINMMYIQSYFSYEVISAISIGLAHEITHCLNMSDVYGDDIHKKSTGNKYICIMDGQDMSNQYQFYHNICEGTFVDPSTLTNRSTEVVVGTEPFCSSCLATMKQKVNNYVTDVWQINGNITQSTLQE